MSDSKIESRWQQRLSSYQKALAQLTLAVELEQSRGLSDLEKQGLIKAYEFTYELAWNVMKDYFLNQGDVLITGSRDAFREAFSRQLINEGHLWMAMVSDRNKTAHTYDAQAAKKVALTIVEVYYPLFVAFEKKMQALYETA